MGHPAEKVTTPLAVDPIAELFPTIAAAQYAALKADIQQHGVREPVWVTPAGQLLDGRSRTRACAELGISCPRRVYRGDDPVAFAVSLNLHRRHLTARERAEVAARIANLRHGTNRYRSKKVDTPNGASTRRRAVSIKTAARLMNVGTMSVSRAKRRLGLSQPKKTATPANKIYLELAARPEKAAPPRPLLERRAALFRAIAALRVQFPFQERHQFVRLLLDLAEAWDTHEHTIPSAEWADPTRLVPRG